MSSSFLKDPSAVLDYQVDWSAWLAAAETISTSTWTVPNGITADSDSHTTTTATIWLSAGTVGTTYTLTNHIVTSAGRIDDREITVKIRNR